MVLSYVILNAGGRNKTPYSIRRKGLLLHHHLGLICKHTEEEFLAFPAERDINDVLRLGYLFFFIRYRESSFFSRLSLSLKLFLAFSYPIKIPGILASSNSTMVNSWILPSWSNLDIASPIA